MAGPAFNQRSPPELPRPFLAEDADACEALAAACEQISQPATPDGDLRLPKDEARPAPLHATLRPSSRWESLPRGSVQLHIYDIIDWQHLNSLSALNGSCPYLGAFHVGVEVYGKEWCYDGREGVTASEPLKNSRYAFRETVLLTPTCISADGVAQVIREFRSTWPAEEYHWLRRNCLTFAEALCQRIGAGSLPAWVDRLPRGACALEPALSNLQHAVASASGSVARCKRSWERHDDLPWLALRALGVVYDFGHRFEGLWPESPGDEAEDEACQNKADFLVTLQKEPACDDKIGLDVGAAGASCLRVLRVRPHSLIGRWNRTHADSPVRRGDLIVQVNGVCGQSANDLLLALVASNTIELQVSRQRMPPDLGGGSSSLSPSASKGASSLGLRRRQTVQAVFSHEEPLVPALPLSGLQAPPGAALTRSRWGQGKSALSAALHEEIASLIDPPPLSREGPVSPAARCPCSCQAMRRAADVDADALPRRPGPRLGGLQAPHQRKDSLDTDPVPEVFPDDFDHWMTGVGHQSGGCCSSSSTSATAVPAASEDSEGAGLLRTPCVDEPLTDKQSEGIDLVLTLPACGSVSLGGARARSPDNVDGAGRREASACAAVGPGVAPL